MKGVATYWPDLFMTVLASLALIEAVTDRFFRSKGINPHRPDIVAPTAFIYFVGCISFQDFGNPWILFLVAFIFRGSIFDIFYNALAGKPEGYNNGKWYDRVKGKITPGAIAFIRILGIIGSYFILNHYGRV